VAVAVKIPGHETLQGRDLHHAGQGFETESAIRLAQENAALELRGARVLGTRTALPPAVGTNPGCGRVVAVIHDKSERVAANGERAQGSQTRVAPFGRVLNQNPALCRGGVPVLRVAAY
jgi:hypothetical protein